MQQPLAFFLKVATCEMCNFVVPGKGTGLYSHECNDVDEPSSRQVLREKR